jgi:Tat protein translocase TatB subunit
MFEVGFTEIILILGIALLVLGPERLPKLANQVGRWAGRARAMARQLRQQLDEEVTVIDADDFGPKAKRPPAANATPPAQPEPPPKPEETQPPP